MLWLSDEYADEYANIVIVIVNAIIIVIICAPYFDRVLEWWQVREGQYSVINCHNPLHRGCIIE